MSSNSDRPNVLILFCDQLRRDALGAYGNEICKTPNLDRLASQGLTFDLAYTPVPVCVPARHSLLTGHRPNVHGYWTNNEWPMDASIPTLPRIFRDAGYVTQAIGKMHFQPPRSHHGFERMLLMEETPATREEDDYLLYLKSVGLGNVQHQHGVRHLLYEQPQRALVPEEHTGNAWVADRTVEFLKANGKRPFFLWSSWIAPHPPYNCVDKWADFYKTEDMPAPISREGEVVSEHTQAMRRLGDLEGGAPERRELRMKRMKACYYAQISHVDEQVGRILDTLDELGLADNTFVIFTSDHGEMLGDHGAWQKSSAYEGAWAIPMILRWPGAIEPGERSDAFASLLDVLPMCLEVAGLEYPKFDVPLPGINLLDERACTGRDMIFCEEGSEVDRFIAVRDRRYKLSYRFDEGFAEFYDLKSDPDEVHNLFLEGMSAQQRARFDGLWLRLLRFERANGPHPIGYELPKLKATWRSPGRNGQLPSWPANLVDPDEKKALNSFDDEVLRAIEKEPTVKLSDLDLDWWAAHGGSKSLVKRAKKEGL